MVGCKFKYLSYGHKVSLKNQGGLYVYKFIPFIKTLIIKQKGMKNRKIVLKYINVDQSLSKVNSN